MTIRHATQDDLPAILALYHQPGMDDDTLSLDEAQRLLERIASYPDYHVWVAEENNAIVGSFALLIMDNLAHCGAPSAVIEDVMVAPDTQGRGIGTQMMRFAIDHCRQKGCYKVALSSALQREDAHRFYDRLGFERHGYSFLARL